MLFYQTNLLNNFQLIQSPIFVLTIELPIERLSTHSKFSIYFAWMEESMHRLYIKSKLVLNANNVKNQLHHEQIYQIISKIFSPYHFSYSTALDLGFKRIVDQALALGGTSWWRTSRKFLLGHLWRSCTRQRANGPPNVTKQTNLPFFSDW